MPQSKGTLSHLCASVAHESARVPGNEMGQRGARRGPETEGAVDVHPRAHGCRDLDDLLEIVERARVDLSRLRADDRGDGRVQRRGELLRPHAPRAVGGHHHLLGGADPEQAERARDRHVPSASDDDAKGWRAREAAVRQVPAGPAVDGVPRRREAGDMGHLASRDEGERGVRGEPKELEHPTSGDHLEGRRRGCRLGEGGVLVPGRDEPVARERGG
jgi:hypothetical protein